MAAQELALKTKERRISAIKSIKGKRYYYRRLSVVCGYRMSLYDSVKIKDKEEELRIKYLKTPEHRKWCAEREAKRITEQLIIDLNEEKELNKKLKAELGMEQ